MIRIALTEEDFYELVAGCVVRPLQVRGIMHDQDVEVILSDIGFERMLAAIETAQKAGSAKR